LRKDANWAFLHPKRDSVRERFFEQLQMYLARAEQDSLAAVMAAIPKKPNTEPANQVPQWLFAFDSAGMATFRTLALLTAHAEARERALGDREPELPFIRASILESLRLWPTTPLVLRQTTDETEWENGMMPAQTGLIIFAPFFHRDHARVPFADRFNPDVWLDENPEETRGFVPFSAGPARCPGRDLVLLLGSTMISSLIREPLTLLGNRLDERAALPGTLSHFTLKFARRETNARSSA
jgi:cytochrome P450